MMTPKNGDFHAISKRNNRSRLNHIRDNFAEQIMIEWKQAGKIHVIYPVAKPA